MARVLTFSYPDEKEEVFKAFKELCKKEGGMSKILQALITDYTKKHAEGNPNFSMEKWVKDPTFQAFPTLGEDPKKYGLAGYTDKDLADLRVKTKVWEQHVKAEMLKRDSLWRIA